MTADLFLASLRFLLVVTLYAFLLAIVIVLARSLGSRQVATPALAPRPRPQARLLVIDADAHGLPSEFDLDGEAVIGRDPACGVCLPPVYVSGHHARMEFSNGRWWIEDLGSKNKTYLNGQQVLAGSPVPASAGDEIVVAGIKLRLADD